MYIYIFYAVLLFFFFLWVTSNILLTPPPLKKKQAICLLTVYPNKIHLDFFQKLISYEKIIICDDNSKDLTNIKTQYPDFIFVQIDEQTCLAKKYWNLNLTVKNQQPSAWDKALYYFCEKKKFKEYKNVWILEEDVFVPSLKTLPELDLKYPKEDLLTAPIKSYEENKEWVWWYTLDSVPDFKMDRYSGMMCVIRVSDYFFFKIIEYIRKHRQFVFLEIFFPSLGKHHKELYYKQIPELDEIHFQGECEFSNIKKTKLYHPVKDVNVQEQWRIKLDE